MEKERSQLQALIQCKCPRCRKGDIFENSALSFNFAKTYKNCPVCNLKYERTLGFFWTAMYISYSFTVAHLVIVMVAINLLTEQRPPLWVFFASVLGSFMFFVPVYFRYSRVLLLYLPIFANVTYSNDPRVWEQEGE